MKAESIYVGVLIGVLTCAAMFGLMYLFGSFGQGTTDILKWSPGFRMFVAVMGGAASAAIGFAAGTCIANEMEGK